MQHFVQLHRVQKYGEPRKDDQFEVFSNKAELVLEAANAGNGIMWLIRCDGRDAFSIAWRFEIEGITSSLNRNFTRDFTYAVFGKRGHAFEPPIALATQAVSHLARCTHDFRHGFSALDADAIVAMEEIVGKKTECACAADHLHPTKKAVRRSS